MRNGPCLIIHRFRVPALQTESVAPRFVKNNCVYDAYSCDPALVAPIGRKTGYVNNKKHLVHKLYYVFQVFFPQTAINGCQLVFALNGNERDLATSHLQPWRLL